MAEESGLETPILEFNFKSSECSSPPDSIYQWRDQVDSRRLLAAEFNSYECGYQPFTDTFLDENCCRASLDVGISDGYVSLGASFDLSIFPKTAVGKEYCFLENFADVYDFEKAYFAGDGSCFSDGIKCFSANKSLIVYDDTECLGEGSVFLIEESQVPLDVNSTVLASFVTIGSSAATIEYLWTTYYPLSLYVQSMKYTSDVISRLFSILSIILVFTFLLW